jgi:GTP-binding protein
MSKVLGKGSSFVDYKRIYFRGGNGGNGMISFLKMPLNPIGPPAGGNGGRGGDLYIRATKNFTSLNHLSDRYRIEDGSHGKGKSMHGQNGENTIIEVPVGTVVRQIPLKEAPIEEEENDEDPRMTLISKYFYFKKGYKPQEDRIRMLLERIPHESKKPIPLIELDFSKDGQSHLIQRGGAGGYGNPHFRSPMIPGPSIAGLGQRKKPLLLDFELKSIADAGLVGLPNAGKSTLLKAVTNAHPEIAPYPFTTLNPYIATIDYSDYWSMTIADMPGIIRGAHANLGLGLRFLRHIERNKIFVYVIDIAGVSPVDDLQTLQNELESYKSGLTRRPSIVVANKADISNLAKVNLEILKKFTDLPIVPISAKYEKNISVLTNLMRKMVEDEREREIV